MKKVKKLQYIFIFVFILHSFCFPQMVAQAESLFAPKDIESHWAAKQISDWTSRSLVGGYPDGTFKPNNNITRAEFIALVNRAFGYTKTAPLNFPDVSEKDWFASEIAQARAIGYIGGYPDGTIKPNNPISRQEAAAILAKILKLKDVQPGVTTFTDQKNIPQWSKPAIDAVVSSGYMGGYPDKTFQPTKFITRAESVSVLDRAIGVLYNQAGTFGSEQDLATITGNVTISKSGITLKNTIISGNLYLTEGIGDGHVTLDNVQVKGTTKVSGGGENSIILLNSNLGPVLVDVPDNSKVRLVAQGSTTIGTVEARTGTKLEESNLTGSGFGEIVIMVPEGAQVELAGDFQAVNVETPNAQVNLQSGTVNTLTLALATQGASINLATGTSVNTLTIHSAATVTGQGAIQTANINSNGVTLETKPTTPIVAEGVEAAIAGEKIGSSSTPEAPGSINTGGNSGGSKKTVAVSAISVTGDAVVGATLTAAPTPGAATGTYQ